MSYTQVDGGCILTAMLLARALLWPLLGAVTSLLAQDFSNLKLLCGALASQGMPTNPWRKTEVEYMCISNYNDIGPANSLGLRSNIAYYVTGATAARATEIKIVANQYTPASGGSVRQQMTTASKVWFKAMSLTEPVGLSAAIASGKPFSASLPKSAVKYEVDRSSPRVTTFLLSIRPK